MKFKKWNLLDEHELRLLSLRCFLIGLFSSIPISIMMYLLMKNIVVAEFAFMGMFFASIYYSIIMLKRDWLDEKIGLFDSYLPGISYQGIVLLLGFASIALSFGFFAMAWDMGGIYSGIAFGLCVNFPMIFMLLRLDVYNNNSRLLFVGEKDGQRYYEQVFGYHPVFYYGLLGIPFGRGPLGASFKRVLECIFLNNGSLGYYFPCFILCLVAGSFILSPDIANNVLPFEIRTYKGFFKFAIICLFLMGICFIPLID
ncbi:hypothetical protein [Methanobrevibacter sp.]|uniref:hypothetical protein n=1 Tax=Methanobrevibacter sp. TaxID=66852 RepID=UPI00388D88F3